MTISESIKFIHSQLPGKVRLVAVSKTIEKARILEAYQAGQRIFGENKVQEMVAKWHELPKDIEWHYIGHLQKNKVKYVVPFVAMIHGADSYKLLTFIDKEAAKYDRKVPVLLEMKVASEESKYGLTLAEAEEILGLVSANSLNNISIRGVMGMATFTDDETMIRSEFKHLNALFLSLKEKYFSRDDQFCEISMGMSDDYRIAISEGSTMVRIGSKIFGTRIYNR